MRTISVTHEQLSLEAAESLLYDEEALYVTVIKLGSNPAYNVVVHRITFRNKDITLLRDGSKWFQI